MRVAIIHPFLFRYARGIERFTYNLANALARRDVNVHLLTWHWQNPLRIDVLDPRVRVKIFPTPRYFAARFMVPFYTWDLLTSQYDFVWIFFAGYGEAEALTLARRQKFGIVFHYPYEQVPHRYREFEKFRLIDRAAQIVSVSRHVADGVREFCRRDSTIIYYGIDSDRFAPNMQARTDVRASLQIALDAPWLISAAALEERKGIQWVLRALPRVLREFPKTRYIVLGDGPHRAALEQLRQELNVAASVDLIGAQENIVPWFQAADLSLILARGEASSLSALESLACGTPVIASCHPPFDELIESSYGIQADEEDSQAVAEAILGLLRDPARRHAMSEAGRARVVADFSWDRAAEIYLQLARSK